MKKPLYRRAINRTQRTLARVFNDRSVARTIVFSGAAMTGTLGAFLTGQPLNDTLRGENAATHVAQYERETAAWLKQYAAAEKRGSAYKDTAHKTLRMESGRIAQRVIFDMQLSEQDAERIAAKLMEATPDGSHPALHPHLTSLYRNSQILRESREIAGPQAKTADVVRNMDDHSAAKIAHLLVVLFGTMVGVHAVLAMGSRSLRKIEKADRQDRHNAHVGALRDMLQPSKTTVNYKFNGRG